MEKITGELGGCINRLESVYEHGTFLENINVILDSEGYSQTK